jgi:hypothetical protein
VSTLALIIIIVVVVLLLLIVGGFVATARRSRAGTRDLLATLSEADHALALARADDRGWDRELLETAAREAFAARSPVEVRELQLLKVVDRPGTEDDQAVFRVITDVGSEELLLMRHGDHWHAADRA